MGSIMQRSWWAWALRGLIALLFGIAAFAMPGVTIATLALFFAAFVAVDGLMALVAVIAGHTAGRPWWAVLIEGILGIVIGIYAFAYPAVTMVALLYLAAFWAFCTGVLEIVAAFQLGRLHDDRVSPWALGIAGVLSIVFSVFLVAMPLAGLMAMAFMIGAYAVVYGISLMTLGFRLRTLDVGSMPRIPVSGGAPAH